MEGSLQSIDLPHLGAYSFVLVIIVSSTGFSQGVRKDVGSDANATDPIPAFLKKFLLSIFSLLILV
jgi:hypothetical protein